MSEQIKRRAVMEGVLYAQRQNLDILRGMRVLPEVMLVCGGGARSVFWRQMMADIFRMPVKTAENPEGPALGAALLAGVASGIYSDIPSACAAVIREDEPLFPDQVRGEAYEPYFALYSSLYPTLKDVYGKLAAMA